MFKILFFLIFTLSSIIANDKVEIYASSINLNDNKVTAKGGVSVIYKDYFLTANKAFYDKKTGDLELFDNIRVNHLGQYKILGDYARLNIIKKERTFQPFYMIDNKSQVWMSGSEGSTKQYLTQIKKGILSGCDPIDPLWTIEFSSSDYNANTKWINIYNARLYIYDIAVFYTPWFGYSLDRTRKTGLLRPSIGLSDSEGFFYQQALYIAEQNWWDLEFKPQIRTKRGRGLYSKFRFVDSLKSKGEVKLGYFKEQDGYVNRYNLQNKEHYGINFLYDNSDFLNQWFNAHLDGQSGLYIDIKQMKDVDYINLESSSSYLDTTTSTQVLSRINLFYNTNQHYFGLYTKYYQDLTLPNNDNTLQKLPTLQYHYYLNSFLKEHLLYSFDIKTDNIYRKINKKIIQTDLNLPITLQTSIFDEYINISYTSNLYMQYSDFISEDEMKITDVNYKDSYYSRNIDKFKISSYLTKAYTQYSHAIEIDLTYNKSSWNSKNNFYEKFGSYCGDSSNKNDTNYQQICEFYNIENIEDEAIFDFSQYIFDKNSKQLLYQKISQKLYFSKQRSKIIGEIENELDININRYLNYYNNLTYEYKIGKISKAFNLLTFKNEDIKLSLSHLYEDSSMINIDKDSSYITSGFDYDYNKHYTINGIYNYDTKQNKKKSASLGFIYKKRCWDFGIKYSENNRPILINTGTSSSVYDKFIYISVILKPFMESNSNGSLISYRLHGDN